MNTIKPSELFKNLAELKDFYLFGHQERVSTYVSQLVQKLNIDKELADLTIEAAELHDIGKIGIPNSILFKPEKLNYEEFKIIQMHPIIGADLLLSKSSELSLYIRHHHERWDGTGYPDGLKGINIPLPSRIISVADSFDAMTSDRPYRPKFSKEEAFSEILLCSGKQFDPTIVDVFIKINSHKPFLIR